MFPQRLLPSLLTWDYDFNKKFEKSEIGHILVSNPIEGYS